MAGSIEKRLGSAKPWRARWRDPSGKDRSQQFARRVDAEAHLVQVGHSMLTGAYVDPSAGRMTVGTWAEEWLASLTSDPSTIEAVTLRVRVHVLPELGKVELRKLTPATVQRWVKDRSKVLAPRTVQLCLTNLSTMLSAAVDTGRIARNPCDAASVRAPKVPGRRVVPWTVEQVLAVRDELPERYRALVTLGAGLGLRQGEAFGLAVDAVDFLPRVVHVRQQVKIIQNRTTLDLPKYGKERDVPLPDSVGLVLAEQLRRFPVGEDGLLFRTREGTLLNRNYFNASIWKPALVRAGVEPSRANGFHALRHFYASAQLHAGTSIRALADYLGHADPGFTLRVYAHLMPGSEDRARSAIDEVLGSEPGHSQDTRARQIG